jgi:hypothetical protein
MDQNSTQASKPVDKTADEWIKKIAAYDRRFQQWEKRAKAISDRYRDFDNNDASKKAKSDFNILWSNVQVLLPATFSRLPKPDVSRRWRDNDPVGRVAALLLERALTFEIEHYPDYKAAMDNSVLDRFLGGRGTAWVRYEPHFSKMAPAPAENLQVTDDADEGDADETMEEEVEYECAPVDYVHWKDFGHVLARTWEEVTGVWRNVYLTRTQLVERFQEAGEEVPLDKKPESATDNEQKNAGADMESLGLIVEIWDKSTSTALWLSPSLGKIMDERPDPLGLENFWPCPKPLFATMTTDNLVPVPDYKMYQDQAKQLDKLAARIDGLIDMLVVKGVYDASIPELARLFKEAGNGDLIPVKNFQAFAEKAGLKGSIDIMDLTPIVGALNVAYEAEEKAKAQIYELMGISDITRGASDPTETFGAQKLKGQYGNMRLRSKQDEVVQFATDLLKIKAQIMCQHFQPQTFLKIAAADQLMPEDQQMVPQALQLLMGDRVMDPSADTKDGPLSAFRIEVSSDSMVQMDEQQEKSERLEFVNTFTGYLEKVVPALKENPELAPLAVSILKFGVSGFKVGKTMEGMIDQMLDQMVKQASQPQPPKPDPEMAKVQGQQQLEQVKLQNAQQLAQQKAQNDAAVEQSAQQAQAQQNQHQNELEAARARQQQQLDAQLEQFKAQMQTASDQRQAQADQQMQHMQGQLQIMIAAMNNAAKVEVAEVTAGAALDAAQTAAANNASKGNE